MYICIHRLFWANTSVPIIALKKSSLPPPALQSYCVAVCYVGTCVCACAPVCVCGGVLPGSFLSAWVTGRSVETSTHTPRRRQWCSWVISVPLLLPLIAARTPEMMQQTSPSTYKDGVVSADFPWKHRRPSVVLWLDSSGSSHICFKSPLFCVSFQASRGERPRSAAAFVTSRTHLWWKPESATESKSEAAQDSRANFKPYLLNSLGFQLHFKEQSVCYCLNVRFSFSLTFVNALFMFVFFCVYFFNIVLLFVWCSKWIYL